MTTARQLLPRFLADYPFQPATAFWRAVEVAALIRHGVPEGRGLDLGCGDGLLTAIIDDNLQGRRLWVGIDPDPAEVALAAQTGLYASCHNASGAHLPFEPNSFDFAISNSVLEHIPNLPPVLCEVARVLKPGGQFLFTVPSDSFHAALRGPIRPGIERGAYLAALDRRCAHVRYWGDQTWSEELKKAGLRLTSATPYLDRRQTQRWETLSRFTGGLLYALAGERKKPIEIQRSWGLRSHGRRMPRPLAAIAAMTLAGPLTGDPTEPHACLLVVAVKD